MRRGAGTATACALVLATLPLLAFPGAAQGDAQPDAPPADFQNAQSNGFGSIAMDPYLRAVGEPVEVEARIVIEDLAALERTSNLLVAFNRLSEDIRVLHEELRAGDRVLQPVREDIAEGGLQHQRFYSPADVLAEAEDGRVELRFNGTVSARADGQWHVGALVIAFDAGWGTVRASDGGGAELYGFTLVMESGAPGKALAPFHGQGNERLLLVPLVAAVAGTIAGGWQIVAAYLGKRKAPRPPASAPAWTPPGPSPPASAASPAAAHAPAAAPSASPPPALPPAMPRRSVYEMGAPRAAPAAQRAQPLPMVRREADMWTMDFGYRLDPEIPDPEAAAAATAAAAASAAVAAGDGSAVAGTTEAPPAGEASTVSTGPVQGPHLPKGWTLEAWRPTPMPPDEEEEEPTPEQPQKESGTKRPPAKTAGMQPARGRGRRVGNEPGPKRVRAPNGGQPSR